ncbi:transcription initiation factor TFIID subunit 6-like [Paramacrobiotus metropolitanus]|uniref:transcription initiation factor TFIID subunit 6-like n=1 Tax=Paramacrobiotus metropolitanus TaxID=2943436 RepID=UPI00244602B5|nr:transcription initiation factor TFIID subunit 6-like [Paramacrobiotus metropolitanus]
MASSKSLSSDQVKIWAETLGVHNLSEEAAEFISGSVSQIVQTIVDRANKNANCSHRMKLLKSDVDSAMQLLNLDPTVDISTGDYIPIRGVSGVGGKTLYVVDDKEKEVQSIARKHGGSLPSEVTLRQHWLAIEGKQPTIPENPAPLTKDDQKAKATNPVVARKVATEKAVQKSQVVRIKDLATGDLSAEQQQYYKDVTEAVIGSNEDKRKEALSSLEHDPGLHALVPRLAVFISEGVKVNVVQQNLALLIYIMRMVKALLDNQSLYFHEYLDRIVPAVTSCCVSKVLCSRPEVDNHWALRGFAAKILASISRNYDSPTSRLLQRLIQIFKETLDDDASPLATRYGAYCALTEFGNETISLMVVPRMKHEAELLKNYQTPNSSAADKKAVDQIRDRLISRVSEHHRTLRPHIDKPEDFRIEYGTVFGPLLYDQFQKDRAKDTAKRPSVSGSVRMFSPQNSVSSTVGSPATRMPVASPASTSTHPHITSPSSAMSPPVVRPPLFPTGMRASSPGSAGVGMRTLPQSSTGSFMSPVHDPGKDSS